MLEHIFEITRAEYLLSMFFGHPVKKRQYFNFIDYVMVSSNKYIFLGFKGAIVI